LTLSFSTLYQKFFVEDQHRPDTTPGLGRFGAVVFVVLEQGVEP
jgi:hypothetical protein